MRHSPVLLYLVIPGLLALALCPARATAADQPPTEQETEDETPSEEVPTEQPPAEEAPTEANTPVPLELPPADKAPEPETHAVETPRPDATVARIFSGGRVGAGLLLPEGGEVLCLLSLVRLGSPIDVRLGSGHSTRGHIVATDGALDLAIVKLETRAPKDEASRLATSPPEVGDPVRIIGHGGSTRNDDRGLAISGLTSFSSLWARVAAVHSEDPPTQSSGFLLDRSTGPEDLGAPVFNAAGEVVGLVTQVLADSGGRALAVAAPRLSAFIGEERLDKPYKRPHHLQGWGGFGVAAHNGPSHLAGLVTLGFRGVFFDRLRLEPWFEVDIGTRGPVSAEDNGGQERPRDLWWSLETGMHVGYRVPIFSEGARNYFVPLVGFRLGWNRFDHKVETVDSLCGKVVIACSHTLIRETDRESSFRGGVELGFDLRHGAIRLGYRVFLDPTNLKAHAMHRVLVTFDGVPLPIRVGDSH